MGGGQQANQQKGRVLMRSFDSFDLVQLPRLSAEDTLTLTYEIETEAEGAGALSEPVQEALAEVVSTRDGLAGALVQKRRSADGGAAEEQVQVRVSDRKVDRCWRAMRDFLAAWGLLDGDPRAEQAREVQTAVFPDGLAFLSKPYKAEWADSETRLTLIDQEKLDVVIEGLGGAPFLAAVRAAHQGYGEALHVTSKYQGALPVDLREPIAAVHGAVRDYAVQVAASRRRSKPETVELADRLLGPIARWASGSRSTKKVVEAPEPAPPPVDTPAPAPVDPSESD
jgi:hypothetical protein